MVNVAPALPNPIAAELDGTASLPAEAKLAGQARRVKPRGYGDSAFYWGLRRRPTVGESTRPAASTRHCERGEGNPRFRCCPSAGLAAPRPRTPLVTETLTTRPVLGTRRRTIRGEMACFAMLAMTGSARRNSNSRSTSPSQVAPLASGRLPRGAACGRPDGRGSRPARSPGSQNVGPRLVRPGSPVPGCRAPPGGRCGRPR